MSGQAGGRGYLFQSLICVLDILNDSEIWTDVSIEPDIGSDKVDIHLRLVDGRSKVIQVKSSQNQINKPDVESWASELRQSVDAAEYELRLIGPCSDSVPKMHIVEGVRIPTPHSLNVTGLIQQSAQKLDAYFERKGTMRVPPFVREVLIEGLVTRVSTFAAERTTLSRDGLDRLLSEWVLGLYPQAVSQAVEMQCTAVWNTIYVPKGETRGAMRKPIISSITLVNDGIRTSVIKGLRLVLSLDGKRCLYKPAFLVNLKQLIGDQVVYGAAYNVGFFSEFAIPRGQSHYSDILFEPCHGGAWNHNAWEPGAYGVELFGAFADRESYISLRKGFLDLGGDDVQDIHGHRQAILRFRELELELE